MAFERAKLKEWRDKRHAQGGIPHMRIAHDDAVVSLNWETNSDRRLTPLHRSISAYIDSGYVFRIDANIDTTIDPVAVVEGHYPDSNLQPKNIRHRYRQQSGRTFTVPAMHFQRPSGRFDEAALFASAGSHWRVYAQRIEAASKAIGVMNLPQHIADEIRLTAAHRQAINQLRDGYFSFKETNRDHRGSLNGAGVKLTDTKAAHLACLRDFLPAQRLSIIGEQEAHMARVVPHVVRELIEQDRFEWHVMTFDKEASEPQIGQQSDAFATAFNADKQHALSSGLMAAFDWELLTSLCENTMQPSVKVDPHGVISPFPISNFQWAQFPQLWVRSQVEIRGETQKTVGFQIIRKVYRKRLKQTAFHTMPNDQDLRDALARRYLNAVLQPVSAFMNSMRERTKPSKRAGGKSARNGPSYINGATFNPAILTAFLNIYRIYFNWFEDRPYAGHAARKKYTKEATSSVRTRKRPGSFATVEVPQVRKITPILDTPALRLGVDTRRMTELTRKAMDPRPVLYRPWLFHERRCGEGLRQGKPCEQRTFRSVRNPTAALCNLSAGAIDLELKCKTSDAEKA